MNRDEMMVAAASMHYLQDMTMEAIAAHFHVSRSTVSRLLAQARETGVVEIRLRQDPSRAPGLAQAIAARFGIEVHVAPVADSAATDERLEQVAMTTARLLGAWFDSSMVLGVAWGTTLAAIGRHLPRKPTRGSVVVQLNGAANQRSTGVEYAGSLISRFASAFEASVHFFPVPAFFDYPETRAAMWRERSVVRVLEMQQRCDIALFSVGAFGGEMPSHVYSAGYLDRDDVAELSRQGVVGDVCTVFLREDGTSEDLALNERATGPRPEQLRRIPRRVCAVAGDGKVAALRAALLAGVITHLVVDEQTATRLAEAM